MNNRQIPDLEIPRVCVVCVHFRFDAATPGYSSYTPGTDISIECMKNHWDFDTYKCSQEDYRKTVLFALQCSDFKIARPEENS